MLGWDSDLWDIGELPLRQVRSFCIEILFLLGDGAWESWGIKIVKYGLWEAERPQIIWNIDSATPPSG